MADVWQNAMDGNCMAETIWKKKENAQKIINYYRISARKILYQAGLDQNLTALLAFLVLKLEDKDAAFDCCKGILYALALTIPCNYDPRPLIILSYYWSKNEELSDLPLVYGLLDKQTCQEWNWNDPKSGAQFASGNELFKKIIAQEANSEI
jgi:hypothetical protein